MVAFVWLVVIRNIAGERFFAPTDGLCSPYVDIQKYMDMQRPKGFAKHPMWKPPTSVGAKNLSPAILIFTCTIAIE
jgi:hypothetical protein